MELICKVICCIWAGAAGDCKFWGLAIQDIAGSLLGGGGAEDTRQNREHTVTKGGSTGPFMLPFSI